MDKNMKNAGVSLVEVLIAMLLVSIALFTIVTIFPRMGQQRKVVNEVDQARIIAMEVLEGLQDLSGVTDTYGNVTLCATTSHGLARSDIAAFIAQYNNVQIGGTTYHIDPSTVLNCGTSNPINTVSVVITWTQSGKPHKITVTGAVK
jgi:Tfp pilus assembly protein PilV